MSRSKNVTNEQKQMVNYLHVRGFSNIFITTQLKLSKSVILKIVNAWRKGDIVKCKKRHRKRKLTAQQMYKVLKYFVNNPFQTYKECIKKLNLPVSRNTVKKVLEEDGIRNRVACEKPFLTLLNQIKRLKFALKYKHLTAKEWRQVSFLDEKTIQTYANGRVLVKRRMNERYDSDKIVVRETQNSTNKVNLVGVVSHSGLNKIYSVSTKLTGKEFEQLIKMKIKNVVRGTLLMDNASIHNKGVKHLLESDINVLIDFPPKSPDINIIENVWALLQRIMNRKLRNLVVSTKQNLLTLIDESWKEIPVNFINNCIMSMPNRLKKVIEMKGKATRY